MSITIEKLYSLYRSHPVITTDSRNVPQDSIFFALKGDSFDGNRFAKQALDKGAAFAVIDNPGYYVDNRCLVTDDSLYALQQLALFHRKNINTTVIGITGTNGKTTTKELTGRVLQSQFKTFITQGNFNNHIGVPLTILSINDGYDFAVVEMGANHPGEIKELCNIAMPDYGVITNIGKAHIEGFGSIENIIKTKKELYDFIKRKRGKIFINSDNNILLSISNDIEKISYGTNKDAWCKGRIVSSDPFVTIEYNTGNVSDIIETKLFGAYNFENILAAVTIGNYFGVSKENIRNAIEQYRPENKRSQIIETGKNRVILDAYNANPASMKVAIESFVKSGYGNKMMILGDMLELGSESFNEHNNIIELAKETGIETVFVGERFSNCSGDSGHLFFQDTAKANEYLKNKKLAGKTILLKASRGIKLEALLKHL